MATEPRTRLPRAVNDWLELEQVVNERIYNEAQHEPIADDLAAIPPPFRPEDRAVWDQAARFVPRGQVRCYGEPATELARARVVCPRDRLPLFEYPWPPRGAGATELCATGIAATPTSSFRSVLSWRRASKPFVLKLSMDWVIGTVRRSVREDQVARGVVVSRVLSTIPQGHRKKLGLEWFDDRAGVVEAATGTGWIFRQLPPCLRRARSGGGTLVPAFSLVSRRGDAPPLLVSMIRQSGLSAAAFVANRVLRPYVSALAYLLFDQGIETEPHAQNVAFEVLDSGELSGKVVLRDWSDCSINYALRIARRKSLAAPEGALGPRGSPFSLVGVAASHAVNGGRPRSLRAGDTVERYGLRSFVWTLAESLVRYFPDYPRAAVDGAFLRLWQAAAVHYLGCRPELSGGPRRIAVDEAMLHHLERASWETLDGHGARATLPARAEALLLGPRARRKPGRVYARVETPIGDLFLDGPRPVFLRPAF